MLDNLSTSICDSITRKDLRCSDFIDCESWIDFNLFLTSENSAKTWRKNNSLIVDSTEYDLLLPFKIKVFLKPNYQAWYHHVRWISSSTVNRCIDLIDPATSMILPENESKLRHSSNLQILITNFQFNVPFYHLMFSIWLLLFFSHLIHLTVSLRRLETCLKFYQTQLNICAIWLLPHLIIK